MKYLRASWNTARLLWALLLDTLRQVRDVHKALDKFGKACPAIPKRHRDWGAASPELNRIMNELIAEGRLIEVARDEQRQPIRRRAGEWTDERVLGREEASRGPWAGALPALRWHWRGLACAIGNGGGATGSRVASVPTVQGPRVGGGG